MRNTLYTRDNLYVLHSLNSQSVDLIYLDPPFNSKRMYSAPIGSKAAGSSFKDMWTWQDVNEAYLEALIDRYPALVRFIESIQDTHSKAMMAYITYMTQRLIEMYRVLKDTGSLYLHVDPTASHYLKIVLDRIFDKENFRNEIVWCYKDGANAKKYYNKKHDILLFYTKNDNYVFNYESVVGKISDNTKKKYRYEDSKGRYRLMGRGITGSPIKSQRDVPEKWEKTHPHLVYRHYIKEGTLPLDWIEIPPINQNSKERTGYPTQKPLALLQRIIKASSNAGDVVFDPFCGCATTCVAAQQLGRKWIGIDIETKASEILIDRLSDDAGLFKNFVHLNENASLPKRTDVKEEPVSTSIKEKLFEQQEGLCGGCKKEFDIYNFEIDHIIPKAKGGGDYYENYQLLCGNCNRIKGDRPMEYLRIKIKARESLLNQKFSFGG